MKNIFILILLFFSLNSFAQEKVYKIQVLRISDGLQLYGLHAKGSERAKRLAEARLFHRPGKTVFINEDITQEIADQKEKERQDRLERRLLKDLVGGVVDPNAKRILRMLVKDFYRD